MKALKSNEPCWCCGKTDRMTPAQAMYEFQERERLGLNVYPPEAPAVAAWRAEYEQWAKENGIEFSRRVTTRIN
jgi:hypothetical protein